MMREETTAINNLHMAAGCWLLVQKSYLVWYHIIFFFFVWLSSCLCGINGGKDLWRAFSILGNDSTVRIYLKYASSSVAQNEWCSKDSSIFCSVLLMYSTFCTTVACYVVVRLYINTLPSVRAPRKLWPSVSLALLHVCTHPSYLRVGLSLLSEPSPPTGSSTLQRKKTCVPSWTLWLLFWLFLCSYIRLSRREV